MIPAPIQWTQPESGLWSGDAGQYLIAPHEKIHGSEIGFNMRYFSEVSKSSRSPNHDFQGGLVAPPASGGLLLAGLAAIWMRRAV